MHTMTISKDLLDMLADLNAPNFGHYQPAQWTTSHGYKIGDRLFHIDRPDHDMDVEDVTSNGSLFVKYRATNSRAWLDSDDGLVPWDIDDATDDDMAIMSDEPTPPKKDIDYLGITRSIAGAY